VAMSLADVEEREQREVMRNWHEELREACV